MTEAILKDVSSSGADARLATLRVLGGLALHDKSSEPIELKARKSRQLLAYLAVPSGQARSREQLAALLWSDRQEEQARGSLRTALSGIRRAIGDDALIVEHDTVKLRPGYLETDYDHLKNLIDNNVSVSKLEDFYSGEFLAGQEHDSELFMDWLRGLRGECADLTLTVLEQNADRLAKEGNNKSAIHLMRESLTLEPLKEQTHRTIMKLYAASGEKAMALAQFRTCKEVLLYELDAGPDPETQALADGIALRDVSVLEELRHQAVLKPEPSVPSESSAPSPDKNEPSIAVLPFVNMSGDAEQNYFADSITEDIIVDLSDIEGLSVTAKSSSQIYRGAAITATQISDELGARYLLEGSVRMAGNSVRISAQLIDGQKNMQLWAERYDRKLDNIFELQSEISQAIVRALKLNLTSAFENITDKRTATNVESYEYYLRGRSLLRETSRRSIELARELFERAVALDPDFALAYTGLADCATVLLQHYDVDPYILDEALAHCDKAIRINPNIAEAYAARGYILTHRTDPRSAIENLTKAVRLVPKMADAHYYLGKFYLGVTNEPRRAVESFKTAFALDQELRTGSMLLTSLQALGNPNELKPYADQIIKLAKRRVTLNPYDKNATLAIASTLAKLGKADEARYWANVASAFDTQDGAFTYNLACAHSTLGSVEEALVQLEKTLEFGCSKVKVHFMTVTDPDLELVRKDPRFHKIIKHYWQQRALTRKKSRAKVAINITPTKLG